MINENDLLFILYFFSDNRQSTYNIFPPYGVLLMFLLAVVRIQLLAHYVTCLYAFTAEKIMILFLCNQTSILILLFLLTDSNISPKLFSLLVFSYVPYVFPYKMLALFSVFIDNGRKLIGGGYLIHQPFRLCYMKNMMYL